MRMSMKMKMKMTKMEKNRHLRAPSDGEVMRKQNENAQVKQQQQQQKEKKKRKSKAGRINGRLLPLRKLAYRYRERVDVRPEKQEKENKNREMLCSAKLQVAQKVRDEKRKSIHETRSSSQVGKLRCASNEGFGGYQCKSQKKKRMEMKQISRQGTQAKRNEKTTATKEEKKGVITSFTLQTTSLPPQNPTKPFLRRAPSRTRRIRRRDSRPSRIPRHIGFGIEALPRSNVCLARRSARRSHAQTVRGRERPVDGGSHAGRETGGSVCLVSWRVDGED